MGEAHLTQVAEVGVEEGADPLAVPLSWVVLAGEEEGAQAREAEGE